MQVRNKERWLVLWGHLGVQSDGQNDQWVAIWERGKPQVDVSAMYDDLVARYSEPHRAYHVLGHIEHCLEELDQVQHLAAIPDAIAMALWYHDAIYDTRAKDNEEKSSELATRVLRDALLPPYFYKLVAAFILETRHAVVPVDYDAQLLVDIDLSILGQSEEKFDEYERQVRKEYGWVPDDAFAAGRSAILKSFLERSTIYSTEFFRDKYENAAQKNLKRSLKKLQGV